MGVYIHYLGNIISDRLKVNKEIISKIEKLFWLSGMINVKHSQLYGKHLITLEKKEVSSMINARYSKIYGDNACVVDDKVLNFDNGYMDFFYNYFDDEFQENAGFDIETGNIYSNKIGSYHFAESVYAANVFKTIYSETPSIPLQECSLCWRRKSIGWLSYIFNESYNKRNITSILDLYIYIHKKIPKKEEGLFDNIWIRQLIVECYDTFIVYGVINGTENLESYLERLKKQLQLKYYESVVSMQFFCSLIKDILYKFKNTTDMPEKKQAEYIIEYILKRLIDNNYIDESLKYLDVTIVVHKSYMALIIKYISEIYDIDFWTLWNKYEERYYHNYDLYYCNNNLDKSNNIEIVTTDEFLGVTGDDRIIYWTKNGDVKFSEELKKWFLKLKNQFNEYLNNPDEKFISIKDVFEMLYEANEKFEYVYTFTEFLDDTIESVSDMRYQAIWHIFKGIMQTPFENDEIKKEIKVTLKRFLAVCYNKELRKKIFEF